jgi:nicotinamide phosphoribosyltransferase
MPEHVSFILRTDGYKPSHWLQYPANTTSVYAHFLSRGGRFTQTIMFGLQYYLTKYLEGAVINLDEITDADQFFLDYFGTDKVFNYGGWMRLLEKHEGCLPISIKAVPEGLPIPTNNILMTVENTDPEFYWLTTYVEGLLSKIWYPTTVATLSYEIRKLILSYLKQTGDEALIDYKLHDFGYRGVSSEESAAIGGLAHLLNFRGTDTIMALPLGAKYYKASKIANSIPAAEHSTMTAWGKVGELAAYENMLSEFPTGLVAVVSDSYDIYNACQNIWGSKLREKVLARDGVLVIRPDSGEPATVVRGVLRILGEQFGFDENEKGYRVLNPKVRVIQGDGVNYDTIKAILSMMQKDGWSADNIAFGMGGALLQQVNRDTQSFAYKCSHVVVDGEGRDVFKKPITDPDKASMAGRLKLVRIHGAHGKVYRTIRQDVSLERDVLQEVFRDGEVKRRYSFDECRANTAKSIEYWRG